LTERTSNIVLLIILGIFIAYRSVFPASPADSVSNTIFDLSIELVGAILLLSIVKFLQNIKQLCFYFQTKVLLRNKEIRLSLAYLYRIKIDDKYLLVKNRTRNFFQPVGGVYKTLPGSEKIFERLKVKADRLIETEKGVAKGDLRVYVKGNNVIEFLEWFDSKQDREISPWREFCEELISPEILPWKPFRFIDYKFMGTVRTPIFTLDSGDKGMFQYEIFDLVINNEQKPILEGLLKKGNTVNYIWADSYLINRLGHDERTKEYTHEIAPHTKWAQDLKYSKIK